MEKEKQRFTGNQIFKPEVQMQNNEMQSYGRLVFEGLKANGFAATLFIHNGQEMLSG